MFDISFVELMVIGVVALLVLGPERLPAAARTVGGLLRRARQSFQSVRAEIEREFAAEEMKRSIRDTARSIDPRPDLGLDATREALRDLGRPFGEAARAAETTVAPSKPSATGSPTEDPAPTAPSAPADGVSEAPRGPHG